jgi:MarR family transcriptional regulator, organic hydroperoxide resistance regulator
MIHKPIQRDVDLAMALLEIAPELLRRTRADLPLDADSPGAEPGWQDVAELRATPGQITLLRVLVEHERCMMQQLAEHLAVAPSTVTAMVKRLLAQGYVERSRDDADWRTVWVKPTEKGRSAVVVFDRARLATLQQRMERLSPEERRTLQAALPALRHLVEAQP